MNEIQTIEQIEAAYPAEWVLIGDYELDELTQLRSGRVVFHDPDRDQVYRKAVELRLPRFAVRCFREMPEDMALIL